MNVRRLEIVELEGGFATAEREYDTEGRVVEEIFFEVRNTREEAEEDANDVERAWEEMYSECDE